MDVWTQEKNKIIIISPSVEERGMGHHVLIQLFQYFKYTIVTEL